MTFSRTPTIIIKIPSAKLNEKSSPKRITLTATATTGSNAPKIEVAVEPISLIAKTKAKLETTVVINANVKKLNAKSMDGKTKESLLINILMA